MYVQPKDCHGPDLPENIWYSPHRQPVPQKQWPSGIRNWSPWHGKYLRQSEDPYFDESAETLLKAIVYYLIDVKDENKTLERCKEIVELGLNENDGRTKVKELFEVLNDDERARVLYASVDIAPDRTYKGIFETLNEKLAKLM